MGLKNSGSNRRFNYLSHLIDASVDGVVRIAKFATITSSSVTALITLLILGYYGTLISMGHAALWISLLWIGVWCTMFWIMSTWVGWMVYTGIDEWLEPEPYKEIAPPHTTVEHVFTGNGRSTKLTEKRQKSSGVGGSKT